MRKTVITFGTFDVFHCGHLNILMRARQYGDRLVVGVSTDALTRRKKNREPVFPEYERLAIVGALECVDHAFYEESLEAKLNYIKIYEAKVLVMGDDWSGRFDECKSLCEVIYLERTPAISTTVTIEKIKSML